MKGGNSGWTFPAVPIPAPSAPTVVPGSQTAVSGGASYSETPQAILAAQGVIPKPTPTVPGDPAAQPIVGNGSLVIPPVLANFVFVQPAAPGSRSPAIIQLQRFLNLDPQTRVSTSGAGSPGSETNFFGPATRAAIQKFQLKHGIVSSSRNGGYGVFGPKTRALINAFLKK